MEKEYQLEMKRLLEYNNKLKETLAFLRNQVENENGQIAETNLEKKFPSSCQIIKLDAASLDLKQASNSTSSTACDANNDATFLYADREQGRTTLKYFKMDPSLSPNSNTSGMPNEIERIFMNIRLITD